MRAQYLGDSYDLVKQAMLTWLSGFGTWTVHPMFTQAPDDASLRAYERLLGARCLCKEVLTADTDRSLYLKGARSAGHLLLDPDTGLRPRPTKGVRAPEYLFLDELVQLARARPTKLTIVFDQSVGRGSEPFHIHGKLLALRQQEVAAFAYVSHACFLIASADAALLGHARPTLLAASRLPTSRLHDASMPLPGAV